MPGRSIRVARIAGIPVGISPLWLVMVGLITWSLGAGYYPSEVDGISAVASYALGLASALLLFLSILAHEFGHALVARRRGVEIEEIDLWLLGGVARMRGRPHSAGDEIRFALAGPAVTAGFSLVFGGLALALPSSAPAALRALVAYQAEINLLILGFNLIPAFPLDGGRILRSVLWGATGNVRSATYWTSLLGRLFAALLIAFGVFQFFLGNWFGGVWMALIGLFLNSAARSGYEQVVVREALAGAPVRRFMSTEPVAVPPSLDLRHLVDDFVYRHHHRAFPVVADGPLEGRVDTRALAQVPRGEWERHTVGEVMRHDLDALTVSPDADALDALAKFKRNATNRLLVAEGDRLVGIIALKDLLRFLDLRIELEGDAAERRKVEG